MEAHRGDPALYNFNAFHKTHDSHVLVCRVKPGVPVCVDSRATGGSPFFFLYQMVFKRVGLRLPFTSFERELLTQINTAPAQLHPNSWAFVRGFQILCGYLGVPSSVDVFLHFFEVKKQGKSLWMSFSGVAGRIILTLFQNSFKGWKGKFHVGDAASNLYWRCLQRLMLATPSASSTSEAFSVSCWRRLLRLPLATPSVSWRCLARSTRCLDFDSG